jgi:hypothetical protein
MDTSKHMVIIASAGRTGTRFFGDLLSSMIPGSYSVHEPDVLEGLTWRTWERIRTFGVYHMLLGRVLGRTGIRNLSQQFIAGRIGRQQLIAYLRRQRSAYYRDIPGEPIIESYYQWYGILPAAPEVFEHYRVVALVRDPRTWVASWMNFGAHFGSRDLVSRFGFRRLDPIMAGDADYAELWADMSPFERLCWTWGAVNGRLLDFARTDPHTRVYRYEDLFLSQDRGRRLADLLQFITSFSDRRFPSAFEEGLLRERRHASTRQAFPDWPHWTSDQACRLEKICGPLMRELGYGEEADWALKITQPPEDSGAALEAHSDSPETPSMRSSTVPAGRPSSDSSRAARMTLEGS